VEGKKCLANREKTLNRRNDIIKVSKRIKLKKDFFFLIVVCKRFSPFPPFHLLLGAKKIALDEKINLWMPEIPFESNAMEQ
jgi:hypothetical protein